MYADFYVHIPARVTDSFVGGKLHVRAKIEAPFISVQTAFLGDVVRDGDDDRYLICMSGVQCAQVPAALDECDNVAPVRWTRFAALRARND